MKPPDVDQGFWFMWLRRAFDGNPEARQGFLETAALHVEDAAKVHHEALLDGGRASRCFSGIGWTQ